MSTPTNGNDGGMKITCPSCHHVFSATPQKPEFSNNFKVSVVTVSHERLLRCPSSKCRQPFVWVVQAAQLMMNVQPVGDEVVEQVEGTKLIKSALELVGGH